MKIEKIIEFHKKLRFRYVFLLYTPVVNLRLIQKFSFFKLRIEATKKGKVNIFPELLKIEEYYFLNQKLNIGGGQYEGFLACMNTNNEIIEFLSFLNKTKTFLVLFKFENYLFSNLNNFFSNFFLILKKNVFLIVLLLSVHINFLVSLLVALWFDGYVVSGSTPKKVS